MLENNPQPLAIAERILKPATIEAVRKPPYNLFGWKILDRWAMNTPENLLRIEASGEVMLLSRLLEQQSVEQKVLTEAKTSDMSGLTDHEILAQLEIRTDL